MSDTFRIDSHKLLFHPRRTARWLDGENIAPLYMEVSPTGACNHRCVFCGLDFMGYKPRFLDADMLRERFAEMGEMGLKSMMFAGEGEPFMHKKMIEIAESAKAVGIDIAFTTNGVLFTPERAERLLPITSWVKVSCNGGSPSTHSQIHGTGEGDFDKVMANLAQAVKLREATGAGCTLGLQMLLLPEVRHEVLDMARRCRDIGLDYMVVKPYSQHPQSKTRRYGDISYEEDYALAEEVRALSGNGFNAVFRLQAMRKWDEGTRSYDRCQALPFWSYMDAQGNIWGCSMYLGDERFCYGNVNESTFRQIWEGEARRASLAFVEGLDVSQCRVGCRMDEINRYLWELKNPQAHVNFI